MIEQQVPPRRSIDFAALLQFGQPQRLHHGEAARRAAPVLGQVADDADNAVLQQLLRADAFDQQPVHRPAYVKCTAQQSRPAGSRPASPLVLDLRQERGEAQPAANRIGGGGNFGAGTKRVEQRTQRLVKIEIADHRHARQQQAAAR